MEEPGGGWQGARCLNWGSALVPHMQSRPTMRMVVETITIMIRMMTVAMITSIRIRMMVMTIIIARPSANDED